MVNLDIFTKLIKLVKFKSHEDKEQNYVISRMHGHKSIIIYKEDALEFENLIYDLWRVNKTVSENATFKDFRQDLINQIRFLISDEKVVTESEVNDFFNGYLKAPIQTWEILKPLYGCELRSDNGPLQLGNFTIYHVNNHKQSILQKYPHAELIYDEDLKNIYSDLLISVSMENRDPHRAEENSSKFFIEFENIIRYLIGNSEIYNVSILDSHLRRVNDSYIISNENISSNTKFQGVFSKLPIDDLFFNKVDNGSYYIWEKLKLKQLSNMDERILSAINWLGKGLKEADSANAFVQYIFALEALFTFKAKGELINASIANQLADSTAFILSENLIQRKKYVKMIKKFYGMRSAVAHGGTQSIEVSEANEAFYLMKEVVIKLLTHPELKLISSMDDLQKWIENKKYS